CVIRRRKPGVQQFSRGLRTFQTTSYTSMSSRWQPVSRAFRAGENKTRRQRKRRVNLARSIRLDV
ncbi:hypothetical protein, partial [Salmonella enterica]|uniref:hypothetical protein n=1 Tax=Salmonella enterica TaxID=28901 RepID=UPI0021B32708